MARTDVERMTSPIVTETTLPLEPVVPDPFIEDVERPDDAAPLQAPSGRRRIID
jgi:hypothetical protein